MTMFSAEKRRFCGGHGGGGGGGEGFGGMSQYQGYDFSSVGSDLDCEMKTEEDNDLRNDDRGGGGGESSSKDEREEDWLQLGIGGGAAANHNGPGSSRVELELMPSSSGVHSQTRPEFRPPRPAAASFGAPYLLQNPSFYNQQEINWAFRPIPISIAAPSSSSSSPFYPRPFQIYAGVEAAPPGAAALVDFRVVQPPRRPHSGVWFMLQASHNQEKEPFLPQISKSYLRIKDGRMTIRLVMKYLVKKLSLENESEIEIRCKGQRLQGFLTVQHVRDNIWSNSNTSDHQHFITLLPNSSTSHHIMVLHYARTHPSL